MLKPTETQFDKQATKEVLESSVESEKTALIRGLIGSVGV